ncbi:fructose-bisphosphate aldolase [Aureococcus anophagefferens]|nr:fructose-bisphosphate aldolase [Aureococcus anophagefferens]
MKLAILARGQRQRVHEPQLGRAPRRHLPQGRHRDAPATVKPGVVTGDALMDLLAYAKERGFAIPAVNAVSSCGINACLEAAAKRVTAYGGPMIVQFSRGGGQFLAGKYLVKEFPDEASVAGCVAGALQVRELAKFYKVPVILHTDHCMRDWLPWFDGLLEANEDYFAKNGEPLFSSHMLDLSEDTIEDNIATCVEYLERMSKVDLLLEMELGITGGEEDGVDNSDVDSSKLYTQPEEVWQVYEALSKVPNGKFTVAAAFGNAFISEKLGGDDKKPVYFVFHGGSGSSREDIQYAIEAGTIKMNIDTDTQWSFWDGIRAYELKNRDYLQAQIGNPDGDDKPNKKYYDPRMCLRSAEEATVKRLGAAMEDPKRVNVL